MQYVKLYFSIDPLCVQNESIIIFLPLVHLIPVMFCFVTFSVCPLPFTSSPQLLSAFQGAREMNAVPCGTVGVWGRGIDE